MQDFQLLTIVISPSFTIIIVQICGDCISAIRAVYYTYHHCTSTIPSVVQVGEEEDWEPRSQAAWIPWKPPSRGIVWICSRGSVWTCKIHSNSSARTAVRHSHSGCGCGSRCKDRYHARILSCMPEGTVTKNALELLLTYRLVWKKVGKPEMAPRIHMGEQMRGEGTKLGFVLRNLWKSLFCGRNSG